MTGAAELAASLFASPAQVIDTCDLDALFKMVVVLAKKW
jgi:hypothetical protein